MKKFYVAANIVGACMVRADTIQEAQKKAEKLPTRKFHLKPMPAGIIVFEANDGKPTGTPSDAVVQKQEPADVQVRLPEQSGGA